MLLRAIFCLTLMAALFRVGPAAAEPYAVGVNDALQLRVQQWLPVEGEVQDWPALAGEYVVGADGAINVPFLGNVPAEGLTRAEIGADISARLQERFALSAAPDAAVEIVRYRPIYVSGLVQAGGEYPFAPGLSVRQAVSLAGGLSDELRRTSSLAREMIQAEGALRIFEDQYVRLVVRKARLDAELADQAEIGEIPGLAQSPSAEAIVLDETLILTAQRQRIQRELEGFDRQKELLEAEIEALEQKQVSLTRQQELSREGVENTNALAERGLAANNRVLDSERLLATIEGQMLDLSTAILRARQGLANTDKERAALLAQRQSDLAVERQRVESELEEIAQRIEMQRMLALETAGRVEPAMGLMPDPSFAILRVVDGEMQEIPADGAMILRPGDVVEVGVATPAMQ